MSNSFRTLCDRFHMVSLRSKSPVAFALLIGIIMHCPSGWASGVLIPKDGSSPIQVQSHRVRATLNDGLARTHTRQVFINPHGRALEAVYVFPFPENASLVGLTMEVGGRTLEGFLAERKTARRSYDRLKRQRIDPALIEQIGRNTFRLSVFPVMPNEPTVIELEWIEAVPLLGNEYRYVYPLALPGPVSTTLQDLTFSFSVQSSLPLQSIDSPNAEMFCHLPTPQQGGASLEDNQAILDQDLVVVSQVKASEPTMNVHYYKPPTGMAYFAAIVTPPELQEDQIIPRDITLALDVSGSMQGSKIEQARSAALWLVDRLREHDRINVLLFNDVVRRFHAEPVMMTELNRMDLRKFLLGFTAGGGTALGDAVKQACAAPKTPQRSAMAVVLTDGLPTVGETEPNNIIACAKQSAMRGLRTYTFGVGEDVDSALLEGIAVAGSGAASIFRPNGEIESRLRGFLHQTSSPAMIDLKVTVDGHSIDEVLPRPLPEVYLGEQVVICGRLAAEEAHPLRLEGVLGGRQLSLTTSLPKDSPNAIARDLYAQAKLRFLQQAIRLRNGLNDQAYFAAVDRGSYSTADELIAAMIDLSLETGVQCSYTSYLALLPEDHANLHPRDATALEQALQRAQSLRNEVAGLARATEVDHGFLETPGQASSPIGGAAPASPAPGTPSVATGSTSFFAGRGKATTAGGGFTKRRSGDGFERWEFWWEHNRDRFLQFPRAQDVPILDEFDLLQQVGDLNPHRATAAISVLSRTYASTDPSLADSVLQMALRHPQEQVHVAALTLLASHGSSVTMDLMHNIAFDTSLGRKHLGRSTPVPPQLRTHALAVLASFPDHLDAMHLMNLVRSPGTPVDLQKSSLQALANADLQHEEVDEFLLQLIKDGTHPFAFSEAVLALCRRFTHRSLTESQLAASQILAIASDHDDERLLRTLATGFGLIGHIQDHELVSKLIEWRSHHDQQVRQAAIIALGRIGRRDAHPEQDLEAHARLQRTILEPIQAMNSLAPFAAFAIGIYGGNPAIKPEVHLELLTQVRAAFSFDRSSNQGAYALALAMLDDKDSKQDILQRMVAVQDQELQGYLAIALALLDATEYRSLMIEAYSQPQRPESARTLMGQALRLLPSPSSARHHLLNLKSTTHPSDFTRFANIAALLGDQQVIMELLALASNDKLDAQRQELILEAVFQSCCPSDLALASLGSVSDINIETSQVPMIHELFDE